MSRKIILLAAITFGMAFLEGCGTFGSSNRAWDNQPSSDNRSDSQTIGVFPLNREPED